MWPMWLMRRGINRKARAADDLPESVDLFDGASVAGSTRKNSQRLYDDELPHHQLDVEVDNSVASASQWDKGPQASPLLT
ncbi:hypothetical protein COOONC_07822 [Cooperia oncophora]